VVTEHTQVAQTNVEKDSLHAPSNELPSPSTSHESDDRQPTQTESILPPALISAQTYYQNENQPDTARAHTYEDIANGGVDIQALLDNITANAEKNAASSLHTPKSATPTATSFPKGFLPPHASLPPRPEIPRIGFRDDISKYHPTLTQSNSIHTYNPPPGVHVPLISAGAPGTSTESRNGLPPPPTASFAQNGSSSSPTGANRPSLDERKLSVSETMNTKWPPEINKKYDEFLRDEQEHVKSGMWGDFPKDSRMFIGEFILDAVKFRVELI